MEKLIPKAKRMGINFYPFFTFLVDTSCGLEVKKEQVMVICFYIVRLFICMIFHIANRNINHTNLMKFKIMLKTY